MTHPRAVPAAALVLVAAAACASIEPPPGGPEDRDAPQVVALAPDSLAQVPAGFGPVRLRFDERVSEQGLEDAVMVSPRTGMVRVDHDGSEVRVSLRGGWRPETIYQVRVEPGIRDLFGNATREPVEVTFATGIPIPDTRIAGRAVERVTGQPMTGGRVEAIRLTDSLVYAARSDSAGGFLFRHVPSGQYRVRAYPDVNANRTLDEFEARDTAEVVVAPGLPGEVALRTLLPDTTPPEPGGARYADGVVEVTFQDYLLRGQPLGPAEVRLAGPDGAAVAVAEVAVGALAPADTAAADTVPADTARPAGPEGGPRAAAPDTLPSQKLLVRPAAPLRPSTEYRVEVRGVRNVNGLVGGGTVPFQTPAPPAPPAPADTAAPATRPPEPPTQAGEEGGPPPPAPTPTPLDPNTR